MLNSIETKSLSKSFGDLKAVDDISFNVENGEIFGFLGPNGAGKSTTMMILTTLLKPTSGQALVSGFDVKTNPKQVRQKIGYVQQESTVDEYLTGRENLLLQARLNHIPKDLIKERIDEVLDLIELSDKQNNAVVTYSGGMRKRLDIAGGLLHRPKILFLDEPTVGLDIQTRRKIWEYIKKIHEEFEMTIFRDARQHGTIGRKGHVKDPVPVPSKNDVLGALRPLPEIAPFPPTSVRFIADGSMAIQKISCRHQIL